MTPSKLNVKTIIANVIRDAQLTDVGHLIDSMIEWAYEAETFIGSTETFIHKECELIVKNNRARLPRDLYQFISFKVNNVYPEVTNRDFRLFYKNSPHLASSSGIQSITTDAHQNNTSLIKMKIENGYIQISGIVEETKGGLSYMAFDLDEDGFPLIKDGHEKAVVAYILWKIKTADFMNGRVSGNVYSTLERRWYWLCGQARGDDEMPNPKEMEYIADMYKQLLPMPNKNYF